MRPSNQISLRWYQEEARDAIWEYFANGGTGNPLVALPTGTGKSIVIGDFVRCMMQHYDLRIIKLTHRKELIAQNFAKLLALWPLAPAGIYSAGLKRRECHHPVTFAGIGSVAKKAALFGHIDFVLIDECHLLGPKDGTNYQNFLTDLKSINRELKVIGFTATPFRLGQGHLTAGGIFTDVCYDLTNRDGFARLLAEGHLCPLVPKRPSRELDISSVGTSAGDYNQQQLQAAVDREEITRRAVDEMLEYGQDRNHWLVFAAGVEHAEHIATMLNEVGVSAIAIHSKMGSDAARDKAIIDWQAGRYTCAVNNDILTTGMDFPAIDFIGHLQPTKSAAKWVQGLGRGTRPFPGKENCLVLDFAGNTARLGTIDDPKLPRAKGKRGGGEAPVKLCPACQVWNHSSVRFCTCCGQEFIAQVKINERASTLELMSGDEPKVLDYSVVSMEYDIHQPRDRRPPSMRVVYFCEDCPLRIKEFVCFESDSGMAKHRAHEWWRKRATTTPPETVAEALERTHELVEPKHLQVWVNTKYPEIMAYDFTGAGFAPGV